MALVVLVTVGTTRHDALVKAVLRSEFLGRLTKEHPGVRIILQHGTYPLPPAPPQCVEAHSFIPSLGTYIAQLASESATLVVVGHAGSGTVLDVLRGPTIATEKWSAPRLVVVPNPTLQGDHQNELAGALSAMLVATVVRPSNDVAHTATRLADAVLSGTPMRPLPPPTLSLESIVADVLRLSPNKQ